MPTLPRSSLLRRQGVRIAAITSTVPARAISIRDEADYYASEDLRDRVAASAGIATRRVAEGHHTALDLMLDSARRMLSGCGLSPGDIDGLIVVTQTPDFNQPNNASLLHGALGLEDRVFCFDLSVGCSGYVYGLGVAASMMAGSACRNVLLVAGDTMSKLIDLQDRNLAPLFGDSASTTLVQAAPAEASMRFLFGSHGKGHGVLRTEGGGFRDNPNSQAGAWHSEVRAPRLAMDGISVFSFFLSRMPGVLQELLRAEELAVGDVALFLLHQANHQLLLNIARKIGVPADRMPDLALRRYGNSSSASIPLLASTLAAERGTADFGRCVLAGFGVGLSWAACCTDLRLDHCPPVAEI